MNAPMTIQVPSVPIPVLHRSSNTSEKAQAMKQRTSSAAGVQQASVPLDTQPNPKYYRVGVAAHLSNQWKTLGGVVNVTQDTTPAGMHVSTLDLTITDRSDLLNLLTRLHEDHKTILWVNALR